MARYHDSILPSDPGRFVLSEARLREFHPHLFGFWAWFCSRKSTRDSAYGSTAVKVLAEHLALGDSRAALVASVQPLLIAAYSDELDCIVMLRCPQALVSRLGIRVGEKLIACFCYSPRDEGLAADITPGPRDSGSFGNVHPLIADFLVDDRNDLAARKNRISSAEWARCRALSEEWQTRPGAIPRDGSPLFSMEPTNANRPFSELVGDGTSKPLRLGRLVAPMVLAGVGAYLGWSRLVRTDPTWPRNVLETIPWLIVALAAIGLYVWITSRRRRKDDAN